MKLAPAILSLFLFASAVAGEVKIQWTTNADPCVGSFNVYYGVTSRSYTNSIPELLTNVTTISNLCSGQIYYIAVTAVTTNGLESDFSNELAFTLKPSPPLLDGTTVTIYFGPFEIRESPDLANWTTSSVPGFFNVPIGASNDFFQASLPGNSNPIPANIILSP